MSKKLLVGLLIAFLAVVVGGIFFLRQYFGLVQGL
jgi:hypothetical protein